MYNMNFENKYISIISQMQPNPGFNSSHAVNWRQAVRLTVWQSSGHSDDSDRHMAQSTLDISRLFFWESDKWDAP